MSIFDVIVVGGGHAGSEAALASARMGANTLLLSSSVSKMALMPCNPAIGGLAKGQIVREIDALGGEMARVTDRSAIQFRMLNATKGAAVQSLRAQVDRKTYSKNMQQVLLSEKNLTVFEASAENLITDNGRIRGVVTAAGRKFLSRAVVLTTGTFLRGLIHVGLVHFPAGRASERPSEGLSRHLEKLGFVVKRLKTGTPARLDAATIDFSKTTPQPGDSPVTPFSYETKTVSLKQRQCHITYTNSATHDIIKQNLARSPLYSGIIDSTGPRYCPSIEDKVVRFPDKDKHQVFLEPEGENQTEYYPNGLSTSLPVDCQISFLRTIPGLEAVRLTKPGYAIEYDYVPPTQLMPSLETKAVRGLFHAGQINGTSGYEEAAAQGLMAGINAARMISGARPIILKRSEAYIGVLIDDLVTKGTNEPYRMFTSRAEHRLILRHDNADMRLLPLGYELGLVSDKAITTFTIRKEKIQSGIQLIKDLQKRGKVAGLSLFLSGKSPSYADFLEMTGQTGSSMDEETFKRVTIEIKYEGYIQKEIARIKKLSGLENTKIPEDFDYSLARGLSNEVAEKLRQIQPISLGQASRISGVTPVAISLLAVMLSADKKKKKIHKTEQGDAENNFNNNTSLV